MEMEKRVVLKIGERGVARGVSRGASGLFVRCSGVRPVIRVRLRALAERVLPGHGRHLLLGVCLLWLWFAVAGLFISPPQAFGAKYKPLPDTGQTKCYDTEGNEITCPSPGQPLYGQDANYQGLQMSFTKHENYNNTGDSVTIDNNTGLMWMTNTADTNNDGKIDRDDEIKWHDAIDYCASLTYAGFSDWRLPSIVELETIVNYGRSWFAIDTSTFSCESSFYWSSTSVAGNPGDAWYVSFNYGNADWFGGSAYVRCVRGGL